MATQKNRFAMAALDDSDDDVAVQKVTKTQKKKEERKITEKVVKVTTGKITDGDFALISNDRPNTAGANKGQGG